MLLYFFKGANGSSSLAQMSPRSRFRAEMARRGYGGGSSSATSPSSSDLLFRLFQPSSSSNPGGSGAGGGPSGFRFFNLGGASSSHNNNNDLDSDLSSDEDEAHWNHNLNSLAQSLPFFLGMRGQFYDLIFLKFIIFMFEI